MELFLAFLVLIISGTLVTTLLVLVTTKANKTRIEKLQKQLFRLEHDFRRFKQKTKTSAFTSLSEQEQKTGPEQATALSETGTVPNQPEEEFELEIVPAPPQAVFQTGKATLPSPKATPQEALPTEETNGGRTAKEPETFEKILAGRWLSWLGAVTVIIGSGLFFQYMVDTGHIGPKERVLIGLAVGLATLGGGLLAMLKDYRQPGQGLAGSAMGILYFSLFAAVEWYELVPAAVGLSGLVLVTLTALCFSGWFNTQATAVLGLFGGFLTPLMLWPGDYQPGSLFTYLFLLDLGILCLTTFRQWAWLQMLALVGTAIAWTTWLGSLYTPPQLTLTLYWLTTFFALFAILGLWNHLVQKRKVAPADFMVILATPSFFFGALLWLVHPVWSEGAGILSLGMAAVYAGLGGVSWKRAPEIKTLFQSQWGLSLAFFVLAVPLYFEGNYIPLMWTAQSLLLVQWGLRGHAARLRYTGLGLLLVVQLFLGNYALQTVVNPSRAYTRYVKQTDEPALPVTLETGKATNSARPVFTPRDLINERSLCFFASLVVLLVLGQEYRQRSRSELAFLEAPPKEDIRKPFPASQPEKFLTFSGWLNIGWMATLFTLLSLEIFSIGKHLGWISEARLSFFMITACLVALTGWGYFSRYRPHWGLWFVCVAMLLACLFCLASVNLTFAQWREQYKIALAPDHYPLFWKNPVFNLRGIGHLALVLTASFLYTRSSKIKMLVGPENRPLSAAEPPADEWLVRENVTGLDYSVWKSFFGAAALAGIFILVTLEAFAFGVQHEWGTGTALGITGAWILYALGVLLAGLWKKSAVLRNIALATFLLVTGKVYLYDLWYLDKTIRMVAFIGLGIVLLFIPWLYRRYRDRLKEKAPDPG